jgi:AcrR family transcriptional regulator
MIETTKARLVAAASDLLDAGGQGAVTLRAVGEVVGVSHNAPYRHFRDRSALLAAVAERDFDGLRQAFQAKADDLRDARSSLWGAVLVMIAYARQHPARYRLLFSDPDLISPDLASADGNLHVAAFGSFQAFAAIVRRCQSDGSLRPIETARLTGLIHATLHGAIDLELGGRAEEAKGLGSIEATMDLLLDLLAQPRAC